MERQNEANTLTKECILTALLRLMQEKPYAAISITDITNVAGVSRMAYYRNYASKDEILLKRLEDEERKIINSIGGEKVSTLKEIILYFARFYQENSAVITAAYEAGLEKTLSNMLEKRVVNYFPIVKATTQGRYAVKFYIGAIMSAFSYWVNGTFEESAEEVAEIINNLIDKENAIDSLVFPDNK